MKTQTYICSLCNKIRIVNVEDNVSVKYVKCDNNSCERSIEGIAGGMILK